jgi:hypothetical protein
MVEVQIESVNQMFMEEDELQNMNIIVCIGWHHKNKS